MSPERCVSELGGLLASFQEELYQRAKSRVDSQAVHCANWDEFKAVFASDDEVYVEAYWDGTRETEARIKAETGATIRVLPFGQSEGEGRCIYSGNPSSLRAVFAHAY
jgi:prolyl-tRNA synthetase